MKSNDAPKRIYMNGDIPKSKVAEIYGICLRKLRTDLLLVENIQFNLPQFFSKKKTVSPIEFRRILDIKGEPLIFWDSI